MSRVSYRRPERDEPSDPRRMMARPLHEPRWAANDERRSLSVRRLIGPVVLLVIGSVALAGILGLAGGPPQVGAQLSPSPSASAVARVPSPSAPVVTPTAAPSGLIPGSSGVGRPRSTPTARPTPGATTPPSSPTAPATPRPADWAPQAAQDFDQSGGEIIDIDFPLKPGRRYQYRDNWWDVRAGTPEAYNHARSRRREVVRAHDGIDIYAPRGSAVVAPFAGTVIEPEQRWSPWHERYGRTVVIVSSEPQSEGYAAVLAHLDATFVEPGTQVRRGEVVGLAGDTGNADGFRVHLHFELRAPFELPWAELGGERLVDAFNPYPSLVAADPKRD